MVARKGDVRKCVYISSNEDGWMTGSDCLKVVLNNEFCHSKFIYYQLKSPYISKCLETISIGATMPSINTGLLGSLEISLPPLPIQRRIASILSAYDDLIENNRKQIKLLEEAAQRLYKEWFVDLRFPGHEKVKIVDGVPEGWEIVNVTDLLEIKYGKDHKALNDGMIPVYGSGGVMRKVDKILHSGESVLIPRKGSLNNIIYVNGDFWTIDTMFYSKPRQEFVAKYAYLCLSQLDMYSFNIGAAVPSMTVKILDGISLLLPSIEIRMLFEKMQFPLFERIRVLHNMIDVAIQSRDRLLAKLMSGEVEV
jgi:type I restriction enzyme S subunit